LPVVFERQKIKLEAHFVIDKKLHFSSAKEKKSSASFSMSKRSSSIGNWKSFSSIIY
jgi:hypothetical protein